MKVRELIDPNDLDRRGRSVLPLPCVYDKANRNVGARPGLEVGTVEVKSSGTGRVYGRRSVWQKAL